MSDRLFEVLDAEYLKYPMLSAIPADAAQVERVANFAGFSLPASYRDFLRKYGAAIVGPYPVFGIGCADAMGSASDCIVNVTQRFRADGWPVDKNALVISEDHAGNPITLDASGVVRRFDHDVGEWDTLGETFEAFLAHCLKL